MRARASSPRGQVARPTKANSESRTRYRESYPHQSSPRQSAEGWIQKYEAEGVNLVGNASNKMSAFLFLLTMTDFVSVLSKARESRATPMESARSRPVTELFSRPTTPREFRRVGRGYRSEAFGCRDGSLQPTIIVVWIAFVTSCRSYVGHDLISLLVPRAWRDCKNQSLLGADINQNARDRRETTRGRFVGEP